ncbi:N-acetyltransferase [Brevibacillus daliensis]|uniref:N-acetyltransferase n=1 Tax=Brevibacillus daliensis TaxID=2892995 RepID=UPI001E40AA77|nr:N-acetyltransferase [Brevibacillus daliensis]
MITLLENTKIDDVMDIWLKSNIEAHNCIPEQYWLDNYELVKTEYLPISNTNIYEDQDTVKGFISIMDGSFIGALFVSNEYRGQGIGKKLINYCKERYDTLELAVFKDNKPAIAFYYSCNFKIATEQLHEDSGFWEYHMIWSK